MSELGAPGYLSYISGASTQLSSDLTINGAKADKFGNYISFSTVEGSILELSVDSFNEEFEMNLYTPPYGKFLGAYFADWLIAASADDDGEQILEVYLKYIYLG
jgi:hypothetical protein